jgi:hypothetical protein
MIPNADHMKNKRTRVGISKKKGFKMLSGLLLFVRALPNIIHTIFSQFFTKDEIY